MSRVPIGESGRVTCSLPRLVSQTRARTEEMEGKIAESVKCKIKCDDVFGAESLLSSASTIELLVPPASLPKRLCEQKEASRIKRTKGHLLLRKPPQCRYPTYGEHSIPSWVRLVPDSRESRGVCTQYSASCSVHL